MEYLPEFRLYRPRTVDEAVRLRGKIAKARILAGGTDLVVNIRRGIETPEALIDINGIAGLRDIEAGPDGGLKIGAAVTLAELAENDSLSEGYSALREAAGQVAATTHREAATVGGNLCLDTRCVFYNQSEWWRRANAYCLKHRGDVCHVAPAGSHCFAAYSGDLGPALMALGGEVEIAGKRGKRKGPLNDLYRDDGAAHLRLADDEILTAVRLPPLAGWRSAYAKARVRGSIDFPLVGVAMALLTDENVLKEIRVALTGTNSCPILIPGTGTLAGRPLNEEVLDELASLLPKAIQPMKSTFTPPGYRRKVTVNLTRSLWRRLTGAT